MVFALLIGFALGVLFACYIAKCKKPYATKCPHCTFKVASNDPKLTLVMMTDHSRRHAKAA